MSDMEVDMVIDEVAGMEADKVGDMMVKIPDEGFTDVTLTIDDRYYMYNMEKMLEVVMGVWTWRLTRWLMR